jgi:UDP-N-acetylmuramoyl-L-alanyl-D-glutamate--2,6-diaminopimelate ligase
LGVAVHEIAAGLADAGPVPGRFESVPSSGPAVVVDYAHTPDALATALATAREVLGGTGRVVLVFGCGGDRDREKRPAMGAAAEAGADVVVVTSDNPRGEDPASIAEDVLAGMRGSPIVELDRRRAIRRAVAEAGPADLVLIAGKGHETTQTTGDEVVPFDDRRVAAEELAAVGAAP